MDLPYDVSEGELAENLGVIASHLSENGVLLVECSSRSPEPSWPAGLQLLREKGYGETALWWAELPLTDCSPSN